MGGAMGGVWVAALLLALCGPVQPQAGPLTASLASGLDLLADGDATGAQDGLSALHREYDKSWRHRVGSAAAEPPADDEDAEGDAGGAAKPAEDDAVPEDALPPKRRRYNRKRLRPQAQDDVEADASVAAKRKKPARDDGDEEHRRRKPGQRRRRPHRPDAESAQDADVEDEARHIDAATEQQGAAQPSVASPSDLKSLLKQTAGQLSLSELLQNRNLSLSDLLKGNRGALSALTAPHGHANDATPSAASTTPADAEQDEPATERHNGFVPSKPRRLPPTPRPSATPSPSSPSSRPEPEPEVTTSRPRRLPAVVARVKAEQQAKGHGGTQTDALDPMNPAMMAMIALEAADTHTSKPRRIPPPTATSTASPGTSSTSSSTGRTEAAAPSTTAGTTTSTSAGTTLPPRDFYPLNVDSLEITTPRLMGVSKAASSKPSWLPPADRIIDAQVFSPGSITNKFRSHGYAASSEQALDRPEMTPPTATTTSTLPPQPATLQNTSDHFRLENETLDLKEGNALDKRKIGSVPARTNTTTSSNAQHANDLDKADKDKAEKRKPLISIAASSGPRRLPPTLAGTRRLPATIPTRPKTTTTTTTTEPPERPRLPFLVNKRAKDKERERDALLPPTRFALPLPEVISVEKMIADARSRGALEQSITVSQAPSERTTTTDAPSSAASTSPSTSTTFASRDEILDLLKSEQSSTRLSRILAERNMTLEDLLQHRERGSSQLHFADFVRSDRNATSGKAADEAKPVDLVPKEIAPAERKDSVNILRSFHEVPKYPFAYSNAGEAADDSEEAASTLSLVNVKPAGIVLPADLGERYHHQRSAAPVTAAAPSRAPRVVVPPPQAPPPPPPPQPYPIPTFRLPEPPVHASNPYLVIKHVPDAMPDTVPDRPDAVVLEHVGEIRQVGVSSSVEEAIVVDSVRDNVRHSDRSDRLDRLSLPSGVKSAIIASTVICGLAIVGFLTIFIVFRWRQKRALIRARGAILCEQLQRGSFRGRSLSPVLVNVSKSSQVQPMQGPMPYYSKKDLSSRATSNTASNRHYYLWRSLRKTFQEDDMD